MRPAAGGAWSAWRGEWLGALNATAAMLPFVLTYGFIVFGSLGEAAAQVGLRASAIAVVIGGASMLLFSRGRVPAASPSASAALILGDAVLEMQRDPALGGGAPQALPLLLAACALIVVGSGALMVLLGTLRAGSLVRFVPQPVLAGFMNGVAILIVVSQLAPLLGLPSGAWEREGLRALGSWQWQALALAGATAALVALIGWRWPRAPAPLLALVLASGAVLAGSAWAPQSGAAGLQFIGPLTSALPAPDALTPLFDAAGRGALAAHAGTLLGTALLLALIGTLESVLNLAAVDQQTDERSDPNRELLALGAANMVCGLLGGLPLVLLRLRALATWAGGGRSWRAVLLGCAVLALLLTLGLPLLQQLPTAAVAGIVVMLAWTLVDRWTRQLAARWRAGDRSAELRWSLAVVALVCAVTLAWGFVAGVGVGVLATMLIFMRAMHRSLVRSRYSAAELPSRRVRVPAQEAMLAAARRQIRVLELEGALFFGNAERLLQEADALPAGCCDLIIDLRRVSTIDASGAVGIARLQQLLLQRGIRLRLAGLTARHQHGRALAAQGVAIAGTCDRCSARSSDGHSDAQSVVRSDEHSDRPSDRPGDGQPEQACIPAYPDADRALEAAEEAALMVASLGAVPRELPLADCALFAGLDPSQQARLSATLRERRLQAGERLFAQGDGGGSLFLLTAGSVSMLDRQREQRFVSFSPGMCFGETAVLDGGGRTADAVADVASRVHELRMQDLDALQRQDPALAAQLYRNLARHLSARLRAAAEGWRHAAG